METIYDKKLQTIYDFFEKPTNPSRYSAIKIGLASPEKIIEWSNGEIKKPETINYRTFKPERDGLFCAKIFGPTKNYECNCGKYKRMKHRGIICEKCGVEVIQSKVRRDRMAHINLAAPCSHIWFVKSLPSKIGNLLDISLKNLERILYFDSFIVVDPKNTDLKKYQLLSDEEYREAVENYGEKFKAGMGAGAIRELLEELDLEVIYNELRGAISCISSEAKRKKLSKQLKIVHSFLESGYDPAWMILKVIPVIPPDLRPLVALEGGRFATSDLNDLYRRLINRNNRLSRLNDLKAPEIIVRNEKRMLQEAVDALFDNGRYGRPITGTNKRPLRSFSDILKGKQGRFRQNLLGKRVDYSGRTVITIGPSLRLHQCGLPKKMALELFRPFVYFRLEERGFASTVKSAKKMVEREESVVWDVLDGVVKEYPVLLNRAPTLHRLGIQAFEPILIEGKAIQLHPLVCTAFNADFDGDQMAVHVPLSVESQIEARVLMLSSNNILLPSNGAPSIEPTQDIVLGVYYMTRMVTGSKGEGKIFYAPDEVRVAYDADAVDLHAKIYVRMDGEKIETTVGRILLWEILPKNTLMSLRHIQVEKEVEAREVVEKINIDKPFVDLVKEYSIALDKSVKGEIGLLRIDEFERIFDFSHEDIEEIYSLENGKISKTISSDDGFHIFEVIEKSAEIPFSIVNKVQDKKSLGVLVNYSYRELGSKTTVILVDRLKDIGYKFSTKSGISISIDDMIIPSEKNKILRNAENEVAKIDEQYNEGLITQGEKYNKVIDIWTKATDSVANEMMNSMKLSSVMDKKGNTVLDEKGKAILEEGFNSVYMMSSSGARGSKEQMRQLAGMRGLMAKPSGEIIETPITANFREGLSVLQYFISTHGARKGLADTALKTANSGYLTRRLADVAQDCIVSEEDCGTMIGIEVNSLMEGGKIIQHIGERILGRTATEDIIDPFSDEIIVNKGEEIDEAKQELIINAGITSVKIRSVLACKSKKGVCSKCYGRDLAYGRACEIGQAVGIIAAQSIGEPGTQLTMRTFHIGGAASQRGEQADIRTRVDGTIRYSNLEVVENDEKNMVVMNRRGGEFLIVGKNNRERDRFPLIYGAYLHVKDGDKVKEGDRLATWDPFTTPILTEVSGIVKFDDIQAGVTMQEKVDPVTGKSSRTIIETKVKKEASPRISIKDEKGKTIKLPKSGFARYILPVDAVVLVEEDEAVKAGDVIAKLPRATTKTTDITGGLPRVAELFEVRKPKESTILSEIDGYVTITKGTRGKQKVIITPVDAGDKREYDIPKGKHINVYEGDYIRAGEHLIGGSANPQNILDIKGESALARYIVDEVQEVYRLQGVRINDKHIEVIVRQMMRRVKIIDAGDTDFIEEEYVDKKRFKEINEKIIAEGGKPAKASSLILGITKASLSTDSFISAASFQETNKVLTESSIAGRIDYLSGLKENVIMGRIIPAGTGLLKHSQIEFDSKLVNINKKGKVSKGLACIF